jgi:hypothetical protein
MAATREQIEHLEHKWEEDLKKDKESSWWRKLSRSRKYLKSQMNRYIRRKNKKIEDDDIGTKIGRKPFSGWEY